MMYQSGITMMLNAFLAGAILRSEQLLTGIPRVPQREERAGRVAVILPARNEERNIRRSAGTLLAACERYGEAHLLVVDDGSTDRTPALLEELKQSHPAGTRLEVLRVEESLPEGWMGKNRACWYGAQSEVARDAEWLLFVDADTESRPELIGRLLAGAQESGADLYSIFSHQELETLPERLIMPHLFSVLAVIFPWRAVNDPQNPLAIANGQCILVRHAVYAATGGHRAVRAEIVEDKALAERIKEAGYRLCVVDGRDVMATRMYTSFTEIWEGWTKNAYLGLGNRPWLLLVGILLGFVAAVLPFVALPLALRRRRFLEAGSWALTLFLLLRNRARAMEELRVPRWYALTVPLGALLCTAIGLGAWYKVVSGSGVSWKGRRYEVGAPQPERRPRSPSEG